MLRQPGWQFASQTPTASVKPSSKPERWPLWLPPPAALDAAPGSAEDPASDAALGLAGAPESAAARGSAGNTHPPVAE